MDFSGKTAFVTGAANGIGLGICRALARNGVNLVLADIEQSALAKAARRSWRPSTCAPARSRSTSPMPPPSSAPPTRRSASSATSISCSTMPASRWDPKPLWEITPRAMGMDFRRQHLRRRQRHPRAGAAHEGAWRGRPCRQHRLDRRAAGQSEAAQRLLCHDQIRRRRRIRSAGARSGRIESRRLRAVPGDRRDHVLRLRATPPRAARRSVRATERRRTPRLFTPPGLRPTMSAGACSMRSRRGVLHLHP